MGGHNWLILMILSRRSTLRWRLNRHDSISNQQPHHCLLNRLFGCRSKKTSKLRVTGLCAGNSPGTGEFPAQMASNAENVSIWWRHYHITFLPGLHSRIWIWFQPYNMEEKHESHCWCWQDSSTQNAYFMRALLVWEHSFCGRCSQQQWQE